MDAIGKFIEERVSSGSFRAKLSWRLPLVRMGFFICLLATVAAWGAIPPEERAALVSLYESTGGENWRNHENWLGEPGTENTWHGVRTDEANTTVLDLYLGFNNLRGNLPPEIGNLTHLKSLEFGLSWCCPPRLGNGLSQGQGEAESWKPGERAVPEDLEPFQNRLTGPIPAEIADLSALETLNLSYCDLTGDIPPGLSNLTNLKQLNLSHNRLTGEIPDEIAALRPLEILHLNSNAFSPGPIPAWIQDLENLEVIGLAETSRTGPLPGWIGQMANLNMAFFFGNSLEGEIPPGWEGCPHLRDLELGANRFEGTLPPSLLLIPGLLFLDANDNQLTGPVPAALWQGSTIGYLNLSGNRLSGPLPLEIWTSSSIVRLDLSRNELEGTLPPEMADRPMSGILLGHNRLRGGIPWQIGALGPTLYYLDLSHNFLYGNLPDTLGALSHLMSLDLSGNAFTREIPCQLGCLVGLAPGSLDLRYNGLVAGCEDLAQFLDSKQAGGDWQSYQTVHVDSAMAGTVGDVPMRLRWKPVAYQTDPGFYEIHATNWTTGEMKTLRTEDKSADHMDFAGAPGDSFTFTILTVTLPCDHNPNTISTLPLPYPFLPTATIVAPPEITRIKKLSDPFRLRVEGRNFHSGCQVLLGANEAPSVEWKSDALLIVGKGAALKDLLPKGQPVPISVYNPDDKGQSAPLAFQR